MTAWFDAEVARQYGQAHAELMAMYTRLTGQNPATTQLPGPDQGPGYRYSDPVDDPDWPQIHPDNDEEPPDRFPEHWSAEPTPRDQAAIDAGNA